MERRERQEEAGVEYVKDVGLRAQKTPLVVDGLPTFALPVLAGSAGEAIDSGALSFLLQLQLAPKEEEEEQQVDQPVLDSVEWVELCDDYGKTHYWNRRSNETAWKSPEGNQGCLGWHEELSGSVVVLAQGYACQYV